MKIVRVIFFSLLALCLILSCVVFIFLEIFDTDQYLLPITKNVSIALGRPVTIGHLGFGLSWQGVTLDAAPVIIADDPSFTLQPFIKINRVRVGLDLRSLVLERKVHVSSIILQSPQIHFIRNQNGEINVHSIGIMRQSVDDNAGVIAGLSSNIISRLKGESVSGMKLKEFGLLTIQDASISFIDQNPDFPVDIWLTGIDASVNGFSLSKPFRASFNACLYSNDPDLHFNALVSLDPLKRSIQISDLSLSMDMSQVDINLLKGISPHLFDRSVFKNISGVVQLNMKRLEIAPAKDLNAQGELFITGGIIKDFNIIKMVLSHTLGTFGWMEGNIEDHLNDPLKDKLKAEDTIIEKANIKFSFHDRGVFIDDFLLKTDILEFSAKGSVDHGANMDMQTMLHLNGDISAALVNELDGLKYLLDDSKRIAIDADLKGVIPHLKYKPNKDFRKKSKKALMQEGRNLLGILFK